MRFYRVTFWAAVAFAFVLALSPQPQMLPESPDKLLHFVAFAVLAGLGSAAYPSTSLLKLFVGLSAFGAVIELLQGIPALNRHSEAFDWVADSLGAALGLAAVWWWRRSRPGDRRPVRPGS